MTEEECEWFDVDNDVYISGRKRQQRNDTTRRNTPKGKKPTTISQVKSASVRQVVKANGVYGDDGSSPEKQLDNCVAGIRGLRSTHTRREVKRDDFKVRDLKREITKTEMKNVNFVAKKVNKERKMSKMNLKRREDVANHGCSTKLLDNCWCGEVHVPYVAKSQLEFYLHQLVEMRLIAEYRMDPNCGLFTYSMTKNAKLADRYWVETIDNIKEDFPCVDFENL